MEQNFLSNDIYDHPLLQKSRAHSEPEQQTGESLRNSPAASPAEGFAGVGADDEISVFISGEFDSEEEVLDAIEHGEIVPPTKNGAVTGSASITIDPQSGLPYISFTVERKQEEKILPQTKLQASDSFVMMTSKAGRMQNDIAKYGKDGCIINVGGNTSIKVAIYGAYGEPVTISHEEIQMQNAIGTLIMQNDLPLNVTVAQLFRAYAGKDWRYDVGPSEIATIETIMDRLMTKPIFLDCKEQLEKHTKPNKKAMRGFGLGRNVVTAEKVKIEVNETTTAVGYRIYSWPALFQYSAVINQVATFPTSLLSAPAGHKTKAQKPKPKSPSREEMIVRRATISRYMLSEIDTARATAAKNKRQKTQNCIIELDAMYVDCAFSVTPRTIRTIRNQIERILDEWKENTKDSHVKSWEAIYSRKKITGYRISLE